MREREADYQLMRRLTTLDCPRCCQPSRHRGDCCVMCLARQAPEPYRRRTHADA